MGCKVYCRGNFRPYIREKTKVGWGTSATKDLTNGNDKEIEEDVCEYHCKIGVIQDSPKSCFQIITMEENILQRFTQSHIPEKKDEALKGFAIIDRRALISIVLRWFGNKCVGRSRAIWTMCAAICAIDAYASIALTYGPLEGTEKKAQDEEHEEFW